ncbi:MAG: TetR family transcriptional regulator [Pseudomonadota bacterium]
MPDSDTDNDAIGRRIERAAAELFVRDGFADTSTAAIARRAATSKRSIYDRFPNKEALFASVMNYLCSLPGDDAAAAAPADDDLEGQLRALALAVTVRFAQPETHRVFASAVSQLPKTSAYVEMFWDNGPGVAAATLAERLTEAGRSGKIRVADPKAAARRYILECCGPLVLRQLFDPGYAPARAELEAQATLAATRFLESLR